MSDRKGENIPTYKDIFNLNLKYIEYLLEKTALSQGYIRNTDITGDVVEQEVRQLLKNLLPQRFHVTHGYIVSAENLDDEPTVSPQVDVIIVDTLVPHSIFIVDQQSGMEIVPDEAVVGIFEVKRTLNQKSLVGTLEAIGTEEEKSAIQQLRDICAKARIRKDNPATFIPGGVPSAIGGCTSNPIIGIISIGHDDDIGEKLKKWTSEHKIDFGMLDIIFSLSGYMACLGNEKDNTPFVLACRNYKDFKYNFFLNFATPNNSRIRIIAMSIGFIVAYLTMTCGRNLDSMKYFFNRSLL